MVMFSWGFPPNYSTGAILPYEIVKAAARRGWNVQVVAAPEKRGGSDRSLPLEELPATVAVLRPQLEIDEIEHPVKRPMFRLINAVDGGLDVALLMAEIALARSTFRRPAIVMSSGPDFAGFVAAWLMKWACGATTRLVLQYRDEWTVLPPPYVSTTRSSRRWETLCLRAADAVTFVTPGKRSAYLKTFPFLRSKILYVHRNGVPDASLSERKQLAGSRDHRRFRLVFLGRFSEPMHIEPLLVDLRAMLGAPGLRPQAFSLVVAGAQSTGFAELLSAVDAEFPGSIEFHRHVNAREVPAFMDEADALLLVCNARYDGWVPLKLFDYMASSRPIIAYGTVSEAAAIVQQTGAGIAVPVGQPASLSSAIAMLRNSAPHQWATSERAEWVRSNLRSRVFDDLFASLERDLC
jgi:glycosyltransferase involved in cell wall biosynthesis